MVSQTFVLLTTAGPFERYGTPVVEACAELGTNYCDITGEIHVRFRVLLCFCVMYLFIDDCVYTSM